jgi:D-alanyl-lipoteichoic acid acyltransferase DltB (MBOAT superfamily)
MTFNSAEYGVFLLLVLAVYWQLPRRPQNVLLIAAAYVFYGWWDPRFLLLLAASTLIDFTVGLRMGATSNEAVRRRWLAAALSANLGILGFFKYWGFFTDTAVGMADRLGLDWTAPGLRVVLPVGISFYTFQSMSYAIDVYRRRVEPCRSLLDYATFVSFFPQLVAGPIERAGHMLPQYERTRRRPDLEQVEGALSLILVGLFRKVVLADTMAPIVAAGYSPGASGGAALLAFYGFALQIYGDFAGYSAIARGSARLLGVELMVNFDAPYLSASPTEFWRRWHISLSTWLRDYLYVPLGGNRQGPRRQLVNLMLVMLIGGLWHGASWTFVVWGGIHGGLLVVHRLWSTRRPAPRDRSRPLRVALTFHAVCVAWIFFRAPSFAEAADVLQALASGPLTGISASSAALVALAAAATLGLDVLVDRGRDEARLATWTPLRRGAVAGVLLACLTVFAGAPPVPFIYFQF